MNILDSKGRLFGKISVLDLGAALVILLVIIGIFFIPGTTGSIAQVKDTKPVEVDLIVRGLSVRNPQQLAAEFNKTKKTNIILRNQPSGSLDVKSIKFLERQLVVTQPDGNVKVLKDPRTSEESFSTDMLMTLGGQGEITPNGVVLGNSQVKIGTVLELDGPAYNFKGSVIEVRME